MKLTKLEISFLVVITLLLPLLKPGYILLLFLQLLIPNNKFTSDKLAYICKLVPLIVGGVLFALWSHSVADALNKGALIRPGEGWELVNPEAQKTFMIHHPLAYAEVLLKTFIVYDHQYFMEIIGDLGFHHVAINWHRHRFSTLIFCDSDGYKRKNKDYKNHSPSVRINNFSKLADNS